MEIGSKTSLDTSTVSLILFTDLENKAFKRYKCGADTPGSNSSSATLRVADVNPHPRCGAGRAHHLRRAETSAAHLPANRSSGALDPQAAGGVAGIASPPSSGVFEILLRYQIRI